MKEKDLNRVGIDPMWPVQLSKFKDSLNIKKKTIKSKSLTWIMKLR